MRYFSITLPQGKGPKLPSIACDEKALGRVVADELKQHGIGAGRVEVREITAEAFEAFRRSVGVISI